MSEVDASSSIKAMDAHLEANVESSDDSGSEDESLDGFDVLTIDRGAYEGAIVQHQQHVVPDLPNCAVAKLARQMSNDTVHAELTERFESLQKRYEELQALDDEKTSILSTMENKFRNAFNAIGALQKRLGDAEALSESLQEKLELLESSCQAAQAETEKIREGNKHRFDSTDKQLTGLQHIVLELGGKITHYADSGKRDLEEQAANLAQLRQIHHVDVETLLTEIIEMKETMATTLSAANKSAVPVFAASRATQNKTGEFVTYSHLEFDSKKDLGDFECSSGLFTVKTSGLYLFFFNGLYWSASGSTYVDLRLNGVKKARSCARDQTGKQYGNLSISAILKLEAGDQIGIFLRKGILCESEGLCTRFMAIYFGA